MIVKDCDQCGAPLSGEDIDAFAEAFVAHCGDVHTDLPFPVEAVRNYGVGLARVSGSAERLEEIGTIEVHRVTGDRIDDWLSLFDTEAHLTAPQNASCYCLEPHEVTPGQPLPAFGTWTERRAAMVDRLRAGTTVGYLAYVDGEPAGWCNASMRGDYAMFRCGDDADASTVGISCFTIAPRFRRHGIAQALLARVVADAGPRGADAIEAYPVNDGVPTQGFRGGRAMYDAAGFTEVTVRQRDTVVRRPV